MVQVIGIKKSKNGHGRGVGKLVKPTIGRRGVVQVEVFGVRTSLFNWTRLRPLPLTESD